MDTPGNLYALLGCPTEATVEDLRKAYYRAALEFHPDKCASNYSDKFISIQHAWQVLGNPQQRRIYDQQLWQREHGVIYDRISIEEMQESEDADALFFSYGCRCGARYQLNADLLEDGKQDITLSCPSCSLLLIVHYHS